MPIKKKFKFDQKVWEKVHSMSPWGKKVGVTWPKLQPFAKREVTVCNDIICLGSVSFSVTVLRTESAKKIISKYFKT